LLLGNSKLAASTIPFTTKFSLRFLRFLLLLLQPRQNQNKFFIGKKFLHCLIAMDSLDHSRAFTMARSLLLAARIFPTNVRGKAVPKSGTIRYSFWKNRMANGKSVSNYHVRSDMAFPSQIKAA
jgi:hypothetical protein